MFNKRNLDHHDLLRFGFAPEVTGGNDPMLEDNRSKQRKEPGSKETAMMEAVERRFNEDRRSVAASMLLEWVSEGEPTWDSFSAMAITMAGLDDLDDDTDYTDEQVDDYNQALSDLAYAAIALGADQDVVTTLIDDESDDAASEVYDTLSDVDDEDEAIAQYAIAGDDDDAMFEAPRIKVVRAGKVVLIRKRLKKVRRTAAQKAALKKARLKSHTSTAALHRRKSLKVRQKRGM